jgi:hypothetical protein
VKCSALLGEKNNGIFFYENETWETHKFSKVQQNEKEENIGCPGRKGLMSLA